ncbi:hypothetical protein FT643_22130 [Ketobacter sp. MCCC 1A13808]|uniref:hypothetical protein n=1 Tax=Ketobacter sp. MCCC 1A13808 TaxID=2602738 RepID=UPI0012EB77AF|nr:hypothetical protein [Ketobacter sp. MCCC 1A13808]MVF14838.1 hypothetical protein [Ketobacter sp. MCCC 1A13808]
MNKQDFATLKVYEYVDELFTRISDLVRPDIEELMNNSSHGLSRVELTALLHDLFQSQKLVALREKRGLFTPSLEEITSAFDEKNDIRFRGEHTYYGLTSAAMDQYRGLKQMQTDAYN